MVRNGESVRDAVRPILALGVALAILCAAAAWFYPVVLTAWVSRWGENAAKRSAVLARQGRLQEAEASLALAAERPKAWLDAKGQSQQRVYLGAQVWIDHRDFVDAARAFLDAKDADAARRAAWEAIWRYHSVNRAGEMPEPWRILSDASRLLGDEDTAVEARRIADAWIGSGMGNPNVKGNRKSPITSSHLLKPNETSPIASHQLPISNSHTPIYNSRYSLAAGYLLTANSQLPMAEGYSSLAGMGSTKGYRSLAIVDARNLPKSPVAGSASLPVFPTAFRISHDGRFNPSNRFSTTSDTLFFEEPCVAEAKEILPSPAVALRFQARSCPVYGWPAIVIVQIGEQTRFRLIEAIDWSEYEVPFSPPALGATLLRVAYLNHDAEGAGANLKRRTLEIRQISLLIGPPNASTRAR
jgi:hypothetical protein